MSAPHTAGWRPISTAPKDGTRVLLFCADWRESIAVYFSIKDWSDWLPVCGSSFPVPTHWQPLPPAPGEGCADVETNFCEAAK